MPQMNGTGPESQGKLTGRGLGQCRTITDKEVLEKLGKGMGLRRKSDCGLGQGKRLRTGK